MPLAATFIENPLAGWANDDLLFAPETRTYFATHHPDVLPVLDWPELRQRFAAYDIAANTARRRSRRGGVQAALVGFAGLVAGALAPVPESDGTVVVLSILAALLAAAATIWGYAQLLTGRRKGEWLTNRYWTERLRQLYFQFILNNLSLATEAMRDPARLAEWHRRRAAALDGFDMRFVRPVVDAYDQMRDDEAEVAFWIDEAWRQRPPPPAPSRELDTLFDALDAQRFVIQKRYATLKSSPGFHTAQTRSMWVTTTSNALTFVILASTVATGIILAIGVKPDDLAAKLIGAVIALSSATIILLRVLNEGLQLASEAERYSWYRAAVTGLANRYDTAEIAGKIELLRDMERLSYQEMRWFLTAFDRAKFVM